MKLKANILDENSLSRALIRISHEILEKNQGASDVVFVGIRTRGVPLANRLSQNILKFEGLSLPVGLLDVTPHRDDRDRDDKSEISTTTEIDFDINDKNVILVDDVLFTGRTVRAGIDAIMSIGRPRTIQLAVLVDRGHRELPIRADYVGKNLPTSKEEIVEVLVKEYDMIDCVNLYEM